MGHYAQPDVCDKNLEAENDFTDICFYKLKCAMENRGRVTKVHVDESEPTGGDEFPFEVKEVQIRKDKWVTDEYHIDMLLGKGKFGEVKKCREKRSGRMLAAKFIDITCASDRKDIANEVDIMKSLQHPRLLQLYAAFENKTSFCLVLELINGGELFERVINDDFILTEKACVMFLRQICEGVGFMHSKNILHLDMKPENILCLTREGNRIKIIDFGLARKFCPKEDLRVLFGTPEFVAPEVVNFDPINYATDMWSIGVICYVLLSGLSPFMGDTEAETLVNVTTAQWDFNAEEFDSISKEAKDFISKLLIKDRRKRMSAAECLEHQWLRIGKARKSYSGEISFDEAFAQVRVQAEVAEGNKRNVGSQEDGRDTYVVTCITRLTYQNLPRICSMMRSDWIRGPSDLSSDGDKQLSPTDLGRFQPNIIIERAASVLDSDI